jgi:deoxycytidylate deaminase
MKESKQQKYDKAYLRMAKEWGKLSYCERKQVGAIIVKDRMIISDGYNAHLQVLRMYAKMMKVIQNGMFYMLKLMQF